MPFYGFAVMCIDHPEVQALIGRVRDRRIITYGRSPQADVRLVDLATATARCASPCASTDRRTAHDHDIEGLSLPMPGEHNALNATAAIAVARELGIARRDDPQGLQELRRRQAPLHPHRRA